MGEVNVFCRASVDARDPTCKAREDCGLFSLTESPSDAVKVIRLSVENGFDCPMYRKTSQRGKSPKAGKGVGRKAKDPTVVLSIRIQADWLDAFGGDKEAAAMYAKNALERVATGGIGNP